MSRASWIKVGVLVALVVAAVVVQLVVGLPSQSQLRTSLDRLGPWRIPVFVGVYAAFCLLPTGPSAILTILGGALLGFGPGLLAVLVGANLGAAAGFAVSRYLGRGAVASLGGARVRNLDDRVREHGFATVLVARLVPLVPFTSANYVFGLTSVRWRPYLAATAVGIVPGTCVYVAVGAFGTRPGSLPFLLALGALVLLSLVGLLRKRLSRGGTDEPTDGAGQPASP